MRTEAGNLPESLVFPIRNGLGVSNDRFGINGKPGADSGEIGFGFQKAGCALHGFRRAETFPLNGF